MENDAHPTKHVSPWNSQSKKNFEFFFAFGTENMAPQLKCHSTYLPGWQLGEVGSAILPPITVHPVKHGSHPKVFPRQSILILPEDLWKEHNLSAHLVFEGNIDPMRSSISPNPQSLLVNPKRRISCLTIFSTLYVLEQGPWDVYRGHIEVFQGQFLVLRG